VNGDTDRGQCGEPEGRERTSGSPHQFTSKRRLDAAVSVAECAPATSRENHGSSSRSRTAPSARRRTQQRRPLPARASELHERVEQERARFRVAREPDRGRARAARVDRERDQAERDHARGLDLARQR
jgi:hypothetical protein